ncbi:MAG: hypothetical protein JXB29_03450 [Sedimentisphaerales bacterium]|nr:hypothetical protein [Sedimentisphaerales bacterium]
MANGAAGAAVAIAEAMKAMGPIICVEPQDFLAILEKAEKPLVVHSPSGFMTKYKYLTSYRGLTFFTKSKDPLLIPISVEMITAKKIVVPQM